MVETIFPAKLASQQPFITRLLTGAVERNKLTHAYLLVGRAQEDKWSVARILACYLNCAATIRSGTAQDAACAPFSDRNNACVLRVTAARAEEQDTKDFCQNCRWIWQGKHPQAWLTLANETSKSGKISVEKARNLSDELAKESQFVRVVVIEDASQEIFHRPAANALLKTIEDPRVNCLFILFATSVEDVLPTVVSRCQVVPLNTTDSLGLSLKSTDLGKYSESACRLAKEVVEKHLHRKDSHPNSHRKDSQGLARIMEFNREMNEILDQDFGPAQAIDLLVAIELQQIADKAVETGELSGYAKQLLKLSETAKEQLEHYVSPKAALESFTLSWWRLASALRPSVR